MKKIVVLSDTHRNKAAIEKLLPVMAESDYVIHLGDHAQDMKEYAETLRGKLITVDGNCDFFSSGTDELTFEVEEVRLFVCHGHKYGVKSSLDRILDRAEQEKADIALFGHTHNALSEIRRGIKLINPGCMTKYSPVKSYCYLLIDGKKSADKIIEII